MQLDFDTHVLLGGLNKIIILILLRTGFIYIIRVNLVGCDNINRAIYNLANAFLIEPLRNNLAFSTINKINMKLFLINIALLAGIVCDRTCSNDKENKCEYKSE